ncbi:MAG TPA: hypothetical protein VFE47_11405 [Tepidisphaeraceae bacterium]|jgi:hypothetical protein|nr:hypothetical protein [Tepidisphaeraceae bacterium]
MLRRVRDFLFDFRIGGTPGGPPVSDNQCILVHDSPRETADDRADARAMLRDFFWRPQEFHALCRLGIGKSAVSIEFPSPLPSGNAAVDRGTLDWYPARDSAGSLCRGKAVLALDILQANNVIASFVARSFSKAGMHGFVLHMPHSQQRGGGDEYDYADFLPGVRQAMADARRARDVILALPGVVGPVAIQGTSFGGFIASVSASFDHAFNPVMLALSGGDVFRVMTRGKADAALLRQHLGDAGLRSDHALEKALRRTEPLRLVHRLNPARTWLYSARRDQVVPVECTRALVAAAGIRKGHHYRMSGCHYTCALNYSRPLTQMMQFVRHSTPGQVLCPPLVSAANS